MDNEELEATRVLIELAKGIGWLLKSMGQDAQTLIDAAETVENYLDKN